MFKLGVGQVIKGYDEGIAKLHVGDHAILVNPGKLAYGSNVVIVCTGGGKYVLWK